jgi:hypothetical protein
VGSAPRGLSPQDPHAWNVVLCAFIVPLVALQRSVAVDAHSRRALAPYTAYVLVYDLPRIFRLWRLNPTRVRTHSPGMKN